MNDVSNFALCATITVPSAKSKNPFKASSILGASFTISGVMCVNSCTSLGILLSGFTNVENSSIACPSFTFTAAISVIASLPGVNPVVSISKTVYVVGASNTGATSGTKYPSVPYNTFISNFFSA